MTGRRPSALRHGLMFAAAAAVLAMQPLTFETYVRLFYEPGGRLVQSLPPESMPVPRALAWSPSVYGFIEQFGTLTSAAVLGLQIGLYCILIYALLRVLNPTFRLTTGVDWDRRLLIRTYMHTPPLIKAFLIGVFAFVPVFALWHVLGWLLGGGWWSFWLRSAAVGAIVWMLYASQGVAGDYETGNYLVPRGRSTVLDLVARGAAAGSAACVAGLAAATMRPGPWLDFYHTLGTIGQAHWWALCAICVGQAAALGFAGGLLLVALGTPGLRAGRRLHGSLAPGAILAAALVAGALWVPRFLRARYDYDPADRQEATRRLAAIAGVPIGSSGEQTVVLLARQGVVPLQVALQSTVGVDAGADSARRLQVYLQRRRYTTSLSDPAFSTLSDAIALQWDSEAGLAVDAAVLTHCPDYRYQQRYLDKLQASPATDATLRYADLLADPGRFAYPDRQAMVRVGDICAHLGQRARAEAWYRRADLPAGQVGARAAEQVRFAGARVAGRIRINGAPASGVRVGLVPMAGARDLQQSFVGPGKLMPVWFRWVCGAARTGADGRFALDHVVEGAYLLVLETPRVRVPAYSTRIAAVHAPPDVVVSSARPVADEGDIDLRLR